MDKNDGNPGAEILIQYFDPQEQAPKRYKVGRPMIPRFFRSAFDNGVTEMFFECRAPPEEKYIPSYGRPYPSSYLECSDLLLVTRHDRPLPFEVHTECATRVEFGPYDPTHGCRIQRWTIEMRNCQEYFTLPKDQPISPELNDMIRRGVSRMGLPAATIWHLEMCAIMEPMQEIMSITKGAGNTMTPQKAMKTFMFHIHRQRQEQQMIMQQRAAAQAAAAAHAAHPMAMNHMGGLGPPPAAVGEAGGKQKAPRKRQRKSTASNGNGTAGATTTTKKGKAAAQQSTSPTASGPGFPGSNVKSEFPSPSLQTNVLQFLPGQCPATDVLVVGEPSMMGSVEYGEEDERTISRIENTQYDPNAAGGGGAAQQQQQNPMFGGGGGMPPHTSHGGTNPNSTPTSNAGMGTPQPGGMGMPPHGYMNDFAMPQNVTEPSAMNNWAAQSMPVGASPSSRRY
ncbi:LIM-domain binding protein [Aphelenchoides avenae]|nr:LIM-domain binding protein [Aphelenchus avenae]